MYIYGPVPSRRLGRSLGVSPIPPKTCSYTCTYCQLGRTTHLVAERSSFFPKQDIIDEIVKSKPKDKADIITFVGDGEPTLNNDLGWLIRETKERTNLPVAVITNGSLLHRKDVREDLSMADIVLPTFDAGNEKMFRAVNRPHRSIDYETMLQGHIDFSRGFSGEVWIEVMLIKDLNDTDKELREIKHAVDMINPDRVYILTPIRPPAESWVEPSTPESIIKAQEIIGRGISVAGLEEGNFGLGEFTEAGQAVLEIGSRHPLRYEQAIDIERAFSETGLIKKMIEEKKLIRVEYNGREYLLPGHFKMGKKSSAK